MSEKRRIEELNDLQKKILFAFAESWTEDLNYISDSEHKSYHLHEKVRKSLNEGEDYFYLELRNLFKYGYLDLINEKFYFMGDFEIPGMPSIEKRLSEITNKMLIEGEKDKSCISRYGMLAINSFLLRNNRDTLEQINKFRDSIIRLEHEIKQHRSLIDSFNSNILTIMAILISAFSIIGINIDSIKYLNTIMLDSTMVYIGTITAINVSLALTIYCLFYLVRKVSKPQKTEKFSFSKDKHFWGIILILFIASLILIA